MHHGVSANRTFHRHSGCSNEGLNDWNTDFDFVVDRPFPKNLILTASMINIPVILFSVFAFEVSDKD